MPNKLLSQIPQQQTQRQCSIYNKFRSSNKTISNIMSQNGQIQLDRQIIKMMKDMQADQILEFSNTFFSYQQNKCYSLQNIVKNQLTQRINIQGDCVGNANNQDNCKVFNKKFNINNQEQQLQIIEQKIHQNKSFSDQIGAVCAQPTQIYRIQPIQIDKIQQSLIAKTNIGIQRAVQQNQSQQLDYFLTQNQPTTITSQQSCEQFLQTSHTIQQDGKHHIVYNNGDQFLGQFQNQMKNGWGDYNYSTGQKYSGFFQDDQIQGYGQYFFLSGAQYQGDWSSGQKSGLGVLRFSNGDRYQGIFKEDLFHGKGQYFYKNGDIFKGIWKQGKRHGKAVFQGIDGGLKIGNWIQDQFQI